MAKITYLMMLILIGVLISGCVTTEQSDDNAIDKSVKDTYIATPTSSYQTTEEENNDSSPLKIIGRVTYNDNTMSDEREYSVDVIIYNSGNDPITFDKVEVLFYDYEEGLEVSYALGNVVTLEKYYSIEKNFESYGAGRLNYNAEHWGKENLVMYIYLTNGNNRVSDTYAASLPPFTYLDNKYGGVGLGITFSKCPLPASK